METKFTASERVEARRIIRQLYARLDNNHADEKALRQLIGDAMTDGLIVRDTFGLHPVLLSLQTALIAVDEIGLRRDAVMAIMLRPVWLNGTQDYDSVKTRFGESVARILHGLGRIQDLYAKNPVVGSENFRNLLLSFSEDMRVVLIMIADRLNLMRQIRDAQFDEAKQLVSQEAAYLYAPLAHKLGLYKLKSELEDLSLKYLEHDAYYNIREKLNATKQARDAYIKDFIKPIEERLTAAGLTFHLKGRTKSIHSIWQKMKKQKCEFEGVYDLFAIRIILDCPREKEKQVCWQVFAIITDMYQSNPKRMRDWITMPKSNGYESLHITVLGPQQKWVEVQIRTERMDEVAERGIAAHWRYKGVKAEGSMDDWLNGIRQMLEADVQSSADTIDQFRVDLEDEEVYVFTPRGDLLKFPRGATILDMAFHIHSKVGCQCTGARIDNRIVSLRYQLRSGDQVEIMTSATQRPKPEWLQIVKTSRAKSKIRLALKETQQKEAQLMKEMLERKFHNRKIDIDEGTMMRTIKKLGYKEVSGFYHDLSSGSLDAQAVIAAYTALQLSSVAVTADPVMHSAEEFKLEDSAAAIEQMQADELVIDSNLRGIDYQLASCCHPIYGDDVFGFLTVGGGIKIHRTDCPNAAEMRRRFGYRIMKARWSGKGSTQYSITLRVIGVDDLGIVNNLTSIISKDEKLILRSINIDAVDGLFRGNLVIMMPDTGRLEGLIKKLRGVKGVKQVERI